VTDPLLDTAPMRPVRPGRRPSGRHPAVPPSRRLTIGAALGLWLTSFLLGSAIGAFTRDDDRTDTVDRPEPAAAELPPPEEPGDGSTDTGSPASADRPAGGDDGPAVPVATSTPTAAQPHPPSRGHGHGHGSGPPANPAGDDRSGPGPGRGHGGEESPPRSGPPDTTTTTAPPTTAPPTTDTTTTTAPAGPADGDTISITPLPG
jgi:hypothetical protein